MKLSKLNTSNFNFKEAMILTSNFNEIKRNYLNFDESPKFVAYLFFEVAIEMLLTNKDEETRKDAYFSSKAIIRFLEKCNQFSDENSFINLGHLFDALYYENVNLPKIIYKNLSEGINSCELKYEQSLLISILLFIKFNLYPELLLF